MIKKLLVCPFFGSLPPWMDKYYDNIRYLKELGYDFLITQDLVDFKQRVKKRLGVECPIVPGTGKVHDYRCTFGELFQPEIWYGKYDFWGHVDFDCVFGRVDKWVTDEFLEGLDIHSNHDTYICGPWTLYRNKPVVNSLFRQSGNWQNILENPTSTGWVEMEYSRLVETSDLRYAYTFWQANPDRMHALTMKEDALFEDDREVMMAHFRRTKRWPPNL
jgi:hypothetical protein